MTMKTIIKLVCPNKCERTKKQKLESIRIPLKKVRRIGMNGERTTIYVLDTDGGKYYNNWICPICSSICVKKNVREPLQPSSKIMKLVKKNQRIREVKVG